MICMIDRKCLFTTSSSYMYHNNLDQITLLLAMYSCLQMCESQSMMLSILIYENAGLALHVPDIICCGCSGDCIVDVCVCASSRV